MVVAMLALIVALGGTSYAAVKLPKGSVGSRELKKNAVKTAHINNSAVTGAKVKTDSLTGADINEASLGQVALAAASAHANAAAALDKVTYRAAAGSAPPTADPNSPTIGAATATCDAGLVATGGGVRVEDTDASSVVDSYPDGGGRSWTGHIDNSASTASPFTVFVVCVPAATVG
jgi:hypothetical protein